MPTDCWNLMTVTGTRDDIHKFFVIELKELPESALKIQMKGVEGLMFKLWNRWCPDFIWLEDLLEKYPSLWVKNSWKGDSGLAGIWVGSNGKEIQRLEWPDLSNEEEAYRFRSLESN